MDDFQQTLNKFEVPQQEQEDLKAMSKVQRKPSWYDRFRKEQRQKMISNIDPEQTLQQNMYSCFIVVALPALLR